MEGCAQWKRCTQSKEARKQIEYPLEYLKRPVRSYQMLTTTPGRIIVVDDDAQVRTLLRNLLETEGYVVSEAANGGEMRSLLATQSASLITLDLKLAGEDGLALAQEVRAQHHIPIIMVTAKADDIDKIIGLEFGADDYITKPFNVREVLARVRAVLRRYEPAAGGERPSRSSEYEKYAFADWILDTTTRELKTADGKRTGLTSAEFNLLELFAKHPTRVLSRDAIMDAMKGHEWVPLDRSIDTLVGRLRRKVEPDPGQPTLIKTIRGVGYVLAADVARV
jgi:two-component system OmpR family response regulator